MAAVTERGFIGLLASTEEFLTVFVRFPLHRGELRILVGTVAEGLLGRLSAGAPKVGFSLLNIDRDG